MSILESHSGLARAIIIVLVLSWKLTKHDVCGGTFLLYQGRIIQSSDHYTDGWVLGLDLFGFLGAANKGGIRELRMVGSEYG